MSQSKPATIRKNSKYAPFDINVVVTRLGTQGKISILRQVGDITPPDSIASNNQAWFCVIQC